jgi:putative FmdB family regulatory protein
MPMYEYQCESCQHRFERIQKFSDPPIETCPVCSKGPVRKLISSPAIQFKGSGWYITDYAKKSSSDSGSTGSTGTAGEKKSETKSESSTKSDASSSSANTSSSTNSTKSDK